MIIVPYLLAMALLAIFAPMAWTGTLAAAEWTYSAFMNLGGEGRGVIVAGALAGAGVALTVWDNGRRHRQAIEHQTRVESAKIVAELRPAMVRLHRWAQTAITSLEFAKSVQGSAEPSLDRFAASELLSAINSCLEPPLEIAEPLPLRFHSELQYIEHQANSVKQGFKIYSNDKLDKDTDRLTIYVRQMSKSEFCIRADRLLVPLRQLLHQLDVLETKARIFD